MYLAHDPSTFGNEEPQQQQQQQSLVQPTNKPVHLSPMASRQIPRLKIQSTVGRGLRSQSQSPSSPANEEYADSGVKEAKILRPMSPSMSLHKKHYKINRQQLPIQKQPLSRRLLTPVTLDFDAKDQEQLLQQQPATVALNRQQIDYSPRSPFSSYPFSSPTVRQPTPTLSMLNISRWDDTKAKYLAVEKEEEQWNEELNRYSRSLFLLLFIVHLLSLFVLPSLLHWPSRATDNELGVISTVLIACNMTLSIIIMALGMVFVVFRNLPRWIQNTCEHTYLELYGSVDVCPFTGVANADETCDSCQVQVSHKAVKITYDDDSGDLDDDSIFSPSNRTIRCDWCVLRRRFLFILPLCLLAVAIGVVHTVVSTSVTQVPFLFYFTWFFSGLGTVLLSYFVVRQSRLLLNAIRMVKRFLFPRIDQSIYEMISSRDTPSSSPIPLLSSPLVSVGTPV